MFVFVKRERKDSRPVHSSVTVHSALSLQATWLQHCPAAQCLYCIYLENEFPLFGQRPLAAEGSHPDPLALSTSAIGANYSHYRNVFFLAAAG